MRKEKGLDGMREGSALLVSLRSLAGEGE